MLIMVSNTCVVFLLCLFSPCVLCALCCQFLWIVHFCWPLRFFLTFIFTSCTLLQMYNIYSRKKHLHRYIRMKQVYRYIRKKEVNRYPFLSYSKKKPVYIHAHAFLYYCGQKQVYRYVFLYYCGQNQVYRYVFLYYCEQNQMYRYAFLYYCGQKQMYRYVFL